MSATLTNIEKIGSGTWRYSFSGTAPFEVHVKGDNADRATTTDTQRTLSFQNSYEPEPLEVVDSVDTAVPANVMYPGRARLQWRGIAGVVGYRVEEYVSSAWTHRRQVAEDQRGYYTFESRFLEDGQTHQFRVIPVYAFGSEGNPLSFNFKCVRNPDPPDIALSYSGGDIIADERS